ncbi:MAG: hypothetical protein ACPG7F_10345 [Aggregatilineales bacterium]
MTAWKEKRLSLAKAVPAMIRLIKQAEIAGEIANVAHGYYMLGFLYVGHSKFSHALPAIQNAFKLFEQIDYKHRMVAVSISEGEMYRFTGYLTQADACYQRAITIADEVPPEEFDSVRADTMFARGNRGHIALANKQYEVAVTRFTQALKTLETHYKDAEDWMTAYETIYCEYGSALVESLVHVDEAAAWQQIEQVYLLATEIDRPLEQAFAHRGIALMLDTSLTPPDVQWIHDSDYHFDRANKYFSATNYRYETARTLEYRMEALRKTGELDTARRLLSDVIQQYTRMGLYERVKRLNQLRQTL